MAKFKVGDTVVGNAQNCHGVTCEDCVITVTNAGPSTFEGIIDEHPEDDDHEGSVHKGLKYEWFDLEDSVDDIVGNGWEMDYGTRDPRTPRAPLKEWAELAYVTIRPTWTGNYQIAKHAGEKARVLSHNTHNGESWEVSLLCEDGDIIEAYETELTKYIPPSYTTHEPNYPRDVKKMDRVQEVIIVNPVYHGAHVSPKAPKPLDLQGTVMTSTRRTRRAKLDVQPEYKLRQ